MAKLKSLLMALIAVLVLVGCAGDIRNRGTDAFDRGDYDTAFLYLRRAVEMDPDSFFNQRALGVAYYKTGQYEDAIVHLKKATEIGDTDYWQANALDYLGAAYMETAHYMECIQTYGKAIALKPDKAFYFTNTALCQIELGNYDEAITAAKRAIELKPDHPTAYNNLGWAYGKKKRYNEAFKAFRKAIELEPQNAMYYDNIGYFLIEKGDYKEAVGYLRKAVELKPNNTIYLFRLAGAYYLTGKHDDALDVANILISQMTFTGIGTEIQIIGKYPVVASVFESAPAEKAGIRAGDRIIEVEGKSTKGWTAEKVVQNLKGREGTAVVLTIMRNEVKKPFEKKLTREKIIPKEAAASFGYRSIIQRQKGSKSEALKDAENAYSLNPDNQWARLALGAARLDQGRYDEAVGLLSEVKDIIQARILEATALAKKGDYQKAIDIYTSIEEELSSKNVPLWNDRTTLLVALKAYADSKRQEAARLKAQGRYKEALKELGELMKIADDTELKALCREIAGIMAIDQGLSAIPEEARKYALRGDVLTEEGKFEAAVKEYRQAVHAAPYIAKLHFNTAMLYGELKKYPQAIRYMKTYLLLAPEAPNMRAAQDQIYKWEFMMEKGEQK